MEKIFYFEEGKSIQDEIQPFLNNGYIVKSVTPQHVAEGGQSRATIQGGFVIVISKQ